MVQVILILAFAVLRLPVEASTAQRWMHPWLVPAAALLIAAFQHVHCRKALSRLDKTGQLRVVDRMMSMLSAARWAMLAIHAAAAFAIGWGASVGGVPPSLCLLFAIVPMLLVIVLGWWSAEPVERRIADAALMRRLMDGLPVEERPSRWSYVFGQVRRQVLIVFVPLVMILVWADVVDSLATRLTEPWLAVLHWSGTGVVLFIAPLLLRLVWGARKLTPEGELGTLSDVWLSAKARLSGMYVWPTHGTLVNAAILGIVWPLKYLLLTDALLERLTLEQVRCVVAHEVGHVKRGHMLWLALSVLASIFVCGWIAEGVGRAVLDDAHASDNFVLLATIASGITTVLVLGAVSRRFEAQADAYSAQYLSRRMGSETILPEAAGIVVQTLEAVARLNGMPIERFGFRHGSIARRQRQVNDLAGRPINALPIDRTVSRVKWLSALALSGSLLPYALEVLRS
jgi:Zn-dependent protease with chaperone function